MAGSNKAKRIQQSTGNWWLSGRPYDAAAAVVRLETGCFEDQHSTNNSKPLKRNRGYSSGDAVTIVVRLP